MREYSVEVLEHFDAPLSAVRHLSGFGHVNNWIDRHLPRRQDFAKFIASSAISDNDRKLVFDSGVMDKLDTRVQPAIWLYWSNEQTMEMARFGGRALFEAFRIVDGKTEEVGWSNSSIKSLISSGWRSEEPVTMEEISFIFSALVPAWWNIYTVGQVAFLIARNRPQVIDMTQRSSLPMIIGNVEIAELLSRFSRLSSDGSTAVWWITQMDYTFGDNQHRGRKRATDMTDTLFRRNRYQEFEVLAMSCTPDQVEPYLAVGVWDTTVIKNAILNGIDADLLGSTISSR